MSLTIDKENKINRGDNTTSLGGIRMKSKGCEDLVREGNFDLSTFTIFQVIITDLQIF